jgi:hypothetical protein
MMKKWLQPLVLFTVLLSFGVNAQQAQEFEDYTVHYNAFNSSMITAEIAKAYGIRRSGSRAVINISVLKKADGQLATAVKANITASGRNLTGQTREVKMREVTEADEAIYYIGELSVSNMETFSFKVFITPEGTSEPFELKFRQQFYTE